MTHLSPFLRLSIQLLKSTLQRFKDTNIWLRVSQLTMGSLLAAVPIITIVLGILGFTPALKGMQNKLLSLFETHLAPGTSETLLPYLLTFAEQAKTLPLAGIILLILTALLLLNSFETSVQVIWGGRPHRSLRDRLLTYWAILTLGPILLAALLSLYGTLLTLQWQGLEVGALLEKLVGIGTFILYFGMLFTLNYLTPNASLSLKKTALASFFGAAGLSIVNTIFSSFAQLFTSYQVVYGAFAALPTVIVWLQAGWGTVLLSICFCAVLHQTENAKDLAKPEA